MALIDNLATRLRAIIAGTYPGGTPHIPAGTFDATGVHLPKQNARFPAGSASAVKDRRVDVAWTEIRFDPSGSEVTVSGPWERSVTAVVRVQYEIVHPASPTPTDLSLSIGALERATRWAVNDAALIQWACVRPDSWTSLTGVVGVILDSPVTVQTAGQHRVTSSLTLRWLIEQSAVTSPGVAS